MVNWPLSGAMGVVGFQVGCKYRYELGSFCNRPTRTSATMRPPTGPTRGPCRRSRPPSGCRTTAGPRRSIPDRAKRSLRLWFSLVVLASRHHCHRRCRQSGFPPRCGGSVHNWALVSGVTPISRATCCPEGRPIFLPRWRFRCDSRPRGLRVGQRRRGQLEQRVGQRSVELAHGPGGAGLVPRLLKNLLH